MGVIPKIKEDWESKIPIFRNKAISVLNSGNEKTSGIVAPYLDGNGKLVSPLLEYTKALGNKSVTAKVGDYIQQATEIPNPRDGNAILPNGRVIDDTALNRSATTSSSSSTATSSSGGTTKSKSNSGGTAKSNTNGSNLGNMDIIEDLPKLSESEIEAIIRKHYKNSKVISPSDAKAIYNAQNSSGVSALVTLGIGGLESGWGTSNIANKTNNLWGYGATNINPEGNAHKYSSMENAALKYSNSLKRDYYNGYGAKTINAIGTGNNPAGKGYAYNDDGSISTTWAGSVTSIMQSLYDTAKSAK